VSATYICIEQFNVDTATCFPAWPLLHRHNVIRKNHSYHHDSLRSSLSKSTADCWHLTDLT